METLKLSFVIGALTLAGGCVGSKSSDTSTSSSTVDSKDSTKESDSGGTTGDTTTTTGTTSGNYVGLFFQGDIAGDGQGNVTDGKYGFGFYPYSYADDYSDLSTMLCFAYVGMANGNPIEATCADCEYTYSITSTDGTGEEGDCKSLQDAGIGGADPAILSKYWGPGGAYEVSLGVGYISSSPKYQIPVVYAYFTDYADKGWILFAYDYDAVGKGNAQASGMNNEIKWARAARDQTTGYEYYYSL